MSSKQDHIIIGDDVGYRRISNIGDIDFNAIMLANSFIVLVHDLLSADDVDRQVGFFPVTGDSSTKR